MDETTTAVPSEVDVIDQQKTVDNLMSFSEAKIFLQRLVDDWKAEVNETTVRRDIRDVVVNIEKLRTDGKLDEDETLVPVRVIDTNIQREQPPYINYLKNSRRLTTFRSLSVPTQDPQQIEQEFTRGMTYTGWEVPHFKCLDGAQTHGWDAVEVVFDEDKPLHVALEHVGHDNLFFPLSSIDIQYAPRIIRRYDVTLLQLDKFVVKYGFAKVEIDKIKDKRRNTTNEGETCRIYKNYFKKDGAVFVAWFSLEDGVSEWLKAPEMLYLGIDEEQVQPTFNPVTGTMEQQKVMAPSPIRMYPFFILPYRETEKPKVTDHKGRVFLDENKQEAHTAILSGFINGITRASGIYASTGQEDGTGSKLKEIQNLKLNPGRVLDKPVDFWHPDYPDPMILSAMKYFDTANSQETGQVNFAAMNREDSRKTAKEIGAAQEQQSLLNSVQLTLFSTYIRSIYSFAWLIVQSQALQNKIKFLQVQVQQPRMNPMMGSPMIDPATQQPMMDIVWTNNNEVIAQVYDVRAAGDVDVIQRQEKIMQMKQDWPVISTTALKDRFLADLVKLEYPDVGEQYAQILEQNSMMAQMQGMIARLGMVLEGAIKQHPELMTELPHEQQADVGNMIKQAAAAGQQMQMANQQEMK